MKQPIFKKDDDSNIYIKPHYQAWTISKDLDYLFAISSHKTTSCPDGEQNQNWYIHEMNSVSICVWENKTDSLFFYKTGST